MLALATLREQVRFLPLSPQVQALLLMRVLNLRLVPALTPGKLQTLVPLLVPVLTTLMRGSPATVLRQVLVLLLVILLLEPALATARLRVLVLVPVPVLAEVARQGSVRVLMPGLTTLRKQKQVLVLVLEPALATVRLRMLVVAVVPAPATQGEQESALLLMPDLAALEVQGMVVLLVILLLGPALAVVRMRVLVSFRVLVLALALEPVLGMGRRQDQVFLLWPAMTTVRMPLLVASVVPALASVRLQVLVQLLSPALPTERLRTLVWLLSGASGRSVLCHRRLRIRRGPRKQPGPPPRHRPPRPRHRPRRRRPFSASSRTQGGDQEAGSGCRDQGGEKPHATGGQTARASQQAPSTRTLLP